MQCNDRFIIHTKHRKHRVGTWGPLVFRKLYHNVIDDGYRCKTPLSTKILLYQGIQFLLLPKP